MHVDPKMSCMFHSVAHLEGFDCGGFRIKKRKKRKVMTYTQVPKKYGKRFAEPVDRLPII